MRRLLLLLLLSKMKLPVEGGYQINGTWGFSSGITHSDYVMVQGNIDVNPETGLPKKLY